MAANHHLIESSSPPLLEMRHNQSTFTTTAASENSGGCGEIVEVQGGHIVRSIGRKDRHSKVCTAKGPRDRRVRLSAPTAIQFYDVQDRLGFDRPSKAVDWLIKKAKSAIDDLAELPPWNPADTIRQHAVAANAKSRKNKTSVSPPQHEEETEYHPHHQIGEEDNQSSFLPASMESDSIADTIKSFFPVASTQQSYHQPPSRANSQNQDLLRLSLQSFQKGSSFANQTEPALFSGQNNPLGFDSAPASWDQNHQSPEFGKIQRLVTWNNSGAADSTGSTGGGGGFVFASPSPVFSQSQILSQRGPLQSINTPMVRAWFDPHHHHHHQAMSTDDLHHHHYHHPHHVPTGIHQQARFQGEQEEYRGSSNKPSSASSDSRH